MWPARHEVIASKNNGFQTIGAVKNFFFLGKSLKQMSLYFDLEVRVCEPKTLFHCSLEW